MWWCAPVSLPAWCDIGGVQGFCLGPQGVGSVNAWLAVIRTPRISTEHRNCFSKKKIFVSSSHESLKPSSQLTHRWSSVSGPTECSNAEPFPSSNGLHKKSPNKTQKYTTPRQKPNQNPKHHQTKCFWEVLFFIKWINSKGILVSGVMCFYEYDICIIGHSLQIFFS